MPHLVWIRLMTLALVVTVGGAVTTAVCLFQVDAKKIITVLAVVAGVAGFVAMVVIGVIGYSGS